MTRWRSARAGISHGVAGWKRDLPTEQPAHAQQVAETPSAPPDEGIFGYAMNSRPVADPDLRDRQPRVFQQGGNVTVQPIKRNEVADVFPAHGFQRATRV